MSLEIKMINEGTTTVSQELHQKQYCGMQMHVAQVDPLSRLFVESGSWNMVRNDRYAKSGMHIVSGLCF